MSEESEHKNVQAALLEAQKEFGRVIKDSTNTHFTSKYASLSSVVSVVVPAMNAHGCVVYHHLVGDDLSVMRTTFLHAATDTSIFCDVPLVVNKNDMQGMKSATTYAKRIGLESLSGIAPEDDDGNDAAKAAPRNKDRQLSPPTQSKPQSKADADNEYRRWQDVIHEADDVNELRAWGTANRPHKEHRYRSNFDEAIINRIAAIKEEKGEA
jgi:hypothetical protein